MSEPWKHYTVPATLLVPERYSSGESGPRQIHLREVGSEWLLIVVECPPSRSILVPPGTVPETTVRWLVCFEGRVAAEGELASVDFAKDIATKCFLTLSEEGADKDLVPPGSH